MINRNLLLVALVSAASYVQAGDVYERPFERRPRVEGYEVVFSNIALYNNSAAPTSLKELVDRSFLHRVSSLPPFYTEPQGYVKDLKTERLDSIIIVSQNSSNAKVVFEYDTLGVLINEVLTDDKGMYATISHEYLDGQESVRTFQFRDNDKFVYKINATKPTELMRYDGGRMTETITWSYKNSMPAVATSNSSGAKSVATFFYTPQKRLSSVKWKLNGKAKETTYQYSDYESSVINPIKYNVDTIASNKKLWSVYKAVCEDKGEVYMRSNRLNEKTVYAMKGGDREVIVNCLLTFTSTSTSTGVRNILTAITYNRGTNFITESYKYDYDGRVKEVERNGLKYGFEYNKCGNLAVATKVGGSVNDTVTFFYTNRAEEKARIEAEKEAERERLEVEKAEQERLEAERQAAEVEENLQSEKAQ